MSGTVWVHSQHGALGICQAVEAVNADDTRPLCKTSSPTKLAWRGHPPLDHLSSGHGPHVNLATTGGGGIFPGPSLPTHFFFSRKRTHTPPPPEVDPHTHQTLKTAGNPRKWLSAPGWLVAQSNGPHPPTHSQPPNLRASTACGYLWPLLTALGHTGLLAFEYVRF